MYGSKKLWTVDSTSYYGRLFYCHFPYFLVIVLFEGGSLLLLWSSTENCTNSTVQVHSLSDQCCRCPFFHSYVFSLSHCLCLLFVSVVVCLSASLSPSSVIINEWYAVIVVLLPLLAVLLSVDVFPHDCTLYTTFFSQLHTSLVVFGASFAGDNTTTNCQLTNSAQWSGNDHSRFCVTFFQSLSAGYFQLISSFLKIDLIFRNLTLKNTFFCQWFKRDLLY